MTKKEFLTEFEDVLELEENTLSGEENLDDLDGWDSLAVMSFIAMVDDKTGLGLSPQNIANCNTIAELMGLLGDKLED